MTIPFLAGRLIGVPLLATEQALSAALAFLGGSDRLDLAAIQIEGGELRDLASVQADAQQYRRMSRQYQVRDGVAVVPAIGSLASRSTALRPASGLTGYSSIREAVETALADDDVAGIMLEIDSGGGEAGGALDTAAFIRQAAELKPTWALVSETAGSSAYALAAAAERVLVPSTGRVGSIGAVGVHIDESKALARRGRTATIVRSARLKARPSGLEPLDDEDRARLEQMIGELHASFADQVSLHRELSREMIDSLQGAMINARDAVEVGLADEICPSFEALPRFCQYLQTGSVPVAHVPPVPVEASMPTFARPGAGASHAGGPAIGADAMLSARQQIAARFNAITTLAEAAGPWAGLATFMAVNTDLSTEEARTILSMAQEAGSKAQSFDHLGALRGMPNPNLGAGEIEGGDGESLEDVLAFMRRLEGREPNARDSIRDQNRRGEEER